MKPRIAQCCCGKTKIQVKADPVIHSVCNCNNCKQRTGSAFGISAYFYDEDVKIIEDATSVYALKNDLGEQKRYFCHQCGTTLFWKASVFRGMTGIAGGCFTEDPLPQPTFNADLNNQCAWVSFPPEMNKPLTKDDLPN